MKTTSQTKLAIKSAVCVVAAYLLSCAVCLLYLFWLYHHPQHPQSVTSFQLVLFRIVAFPSYDMGWKIDDAFPAVAINVFILGGAAFLVAGAALHIYHRRILKDHVA